MTDKPFSSIREISSISKDELEEKSKLHARAISLGERLVLCKTLTKYKMYLDSRDLGITPNILMDGYWESWITQFIAKTVQPGNVCIDAGANFGYYSLLLAELAGNEGKTIAVEPNAFLCHLLSYTNSVNEFKYIIENKALSDHTGKMMLSIPNNFWGGATIRTTQLEEDSTQEMVRVDTLDNIVAQTGLGKVDFIKMDCEGAEPMIFAGMEKTLQQNPQIKIVMEYSPFLYQDAAAFTHYLFSKFDVSTIKFDASLAKYSENDIPHLLALTDHIDLFLEVKRMYSPVTGGEAVTVNNS
ncbi:MAG TPA: FkbM family methyltransferase [Chitinophagaceae bacterium]|nr:FkbM family methyltransferase [Chitinophagaceae bacterium]